MGRAATIDLGGDLWEAAQASGVPYAELACLARSLGTGASLSVEPGACVVDYGPAGRVRYPVGWLPTAEAFDCLTETSALGRVREELGRRIEQERAREASEILRRAGVLGGHGLGEGGGEAS